MYPNALIVTDEYDCKEHRRELIAHCASRNLRPKVVDRAYWPEYFKHIAHHSEPILYYASPSHFHSSDNEILDFHKKNHQHSLLLSHEQEVVSFRPNLVNVKSDGQFQLHKNNHPFRFKFVNTHIKKPQINSVAICVIAHKRTKYLELALNSLSHSLGEQEIPTYLVSNGSTKEVCDFYLSSDINKTLKYILISPNTGTAVTYYLREWFRENHPEIQQLIIMEDDFILPSAARYVYPHWPWKFAYLLQNGWDLVCWLPSLENLPHIFHNQSRYLEYPELGEITRDCDKTSLWVDSRNNHNMFLTGNALAFDFKFYDLVRQTVAKGAAPTDYNFFQIASRVCAPKLFGYHIGWNQEQDGYGALDDLKRWGEMPPLAFITHEDKTQTYNFLELP